MSHKTLLSLFCITFSLYTYSAPTNRSNINDDITQHFLQSVQKHPKKTITGTPILIYGLKLVYEGTKTRAIKPDNNRTYDRLGISTEVIGGLIITAGALLLYPIIRDTIFPENNNAEKTNLSELPNKK